MPKVVIISDLRVASGVSNIGKLFSGLDFSALLCLSLCTSVGGKPQPKGTRGYDVVNYIYRAATCCHKNQ